MNETYNIPINQPGSGCGSAASWATILEPNTPGIAAEPCCKNKPSIADMQQTALEILRGCEAQTDRLLNNLRGASDAQNNDAPAQCMEHAAGMLVEEAKRLSDKLSAIEKMLFGC